MKLILSTTLHGKRNSISPGRQKAKSMLKALEKTIGDFGGLSSQALTQQS